MKKLFIFILLIVIILIGVLSLTTKQTIYRDGTYNGKSQARYINEPYVGNVNIIIKRGKITDVNFSIIDTTLKEIFNEKYENHFEGNELYKQQCRNDWKGVQTYPAKLITTQDIENVDAVSGATWSYNIFKASVKEALKNNK